MRIAIVTTFYPNSAEPLRAVFVRNLAVALSARAAVTIVSPVPWAPAFPKRPRWSALRAVTLQRWDGDKVVHHPRFFAAPKLDELNGLTYACGVLSVLRRLVREGVELLHAHCAYPDSVGVALCAAVLGIPFVITAHGSDINVYAQRRAIRPQLRWALRRAAAVIAVSRPIQQKIRELVPDIHERVLHIPCAGVNRQVFTLQDSAGARERLGLGAVGRLIVFAGQLVPIKAVDVLLQAWERLLGAGRLNATDRLAIVGDGRLRPELARMADAASFRGTVHFAGEVSQESLASWLAAADAFCLPSRNEGTPNVIVEALASGRPVVASRVGGIPELITHGVNGLLASPEDPDSLAEALALALETRWDAARIAATVADYTWDNLAKRNLAVLENVLAGRDRVNNAFIE